jgi:predicted alpha/beta hydrolase family esterase
MSNLVIAGHSLGVTSALDYIEQSPVKIKALLSVSGFSKDYGSELNNFFLKEKSIDMEKVKQYVERSFVFYGDNDPYVPQETLQSLGNELDVTPVIIHNGGHLNTDAGFTTFPQLLDILKTI